jgi:hypothetical protein
MDETTLRNLLALVILIVLTGSLYAPSQPAPPPVVVIQVDRPGEQQASGCLPLLLLAGAILVALTWL